MFETSLTLLWTISTVTADKYVPQNAFKVACTCIYIYIYIYLYVYVYVSHDSIKAISLSRQETCMFQDLAQVNKFHPVTCQFAIQTVKDQDIYNYNIARGSVWVWNLVPDTEGET